MYEMNVGSSAPPAGMAPNGKPRAVPRSQGFQERPQSSRLIQGRPTGMMSSGRRRRCAATHSASPIAKIAKATTTMSIPSANSGLPKVRRGWPVCVPTKPIATPRNSAMNHRNRETPSTGGHGRLTNAARDLVLFLGVEPREPPRPGSARPMIRCEPEAAPAQPRLFLVAPLCGFRLVRRPLSVPASSSMTALISVGLPAAIAAVSASVSSDGVVTL